MIHAPDCDGPDPWCSNACVDAWEAARDTPDTPITEGCVTTPDLS